MPTEEAVGHYERAIDLCMAAPDEGPEHERAMRNAASELLLAVKKACGPYPQAHGRLAMIFLDLGDQRRMKEHLDLALQQDPHEFNARGTRVFVALNEYRESDGLHSLDVEGMLGAMFRSAKASGTQRALAREIQAFSEAFHQLIARDPDVATWLWASGIMIDLGDDIQGLRFPGGRPNLYQEVLAVPWARVRGNGHDPAIAELVRTAEGRSLMHRDR